MGGLAVSVRAEPRFTRDLDLAVAVTDEHDVESLVFGLRSDGFVVKALVEQTAAARLATARLAPAGGTDAGLLLDLLFASSGIEAEVCRDAEPVEVFPGLIVPVARLHHLIVLKALARDDTTRPQDAADLRALIALADPTDLDKAREAADLVTVRGYNRSRDLPAAVEAAWREFGGRFPHEDL